MKTKDELLKELVDTVDTAIAPKEDIILIGEGEIDDEPGGVGFLDEQGEMNFDGFLKDTDIGTVEQLAEAIETIQEKLKEEEIPVGEPEA